MSILVNPYPIFNNPLTIIASITNDFPAVVTTTADHTYLTGLIVRLVIPPEYGMTEANQLFGSIVVTGVTTFEIFIDTRYFNPFVIPDTQYQYAQVIPFAEDNFTLSSAIQNVLPY
jgi:hypothetical protein